VGDLQAKTNCGVVVRRCVKSMVGKESSTRVLVVVRTIVGWSNILLVVLVENLILKGEESI